VSFKVLGSIHAKCGYSYDALRLWGLLSRMNLHLLHHWHRISDRWRRVTGPLGKWFRRVGLTYVTAFAAITAAVFSGMQWREMHESGTDTHNLASDTQRLANAAANEALAARDQAAEMSSEAATAQSELGDLDRSVSAAERNATAAQTQAKAMAESLSFAQQSATAAQGSAKAAQTALTSDQKRLRAYLTSDMRGIADASQGSKAVGSVAIKNVGQTPAYNVVVHGVTTFYTWPLTEADYPRIYQSIGPLIPDKTDLTVSPGADFSSHMKLVFSMITGSYMDSIKDGERYRLISIGYITYNDVFAKPHTTWFCYSYFGTETDASHGQYCDLGNGAN